MSLEKSLFITFFAASMHWENHVVVRLLLVFHYWTLCIDDMQQKTIHATKDYFLNFYKTKGYFFDLIIKTKDLRAQYICSWETPETCPRSVLQKGQLFRRTSLGYCFWNIWKCSLLLFCYFTIFSEAILQRNSRSSLPDVLLKKGTA